MGVPKSRLEEPPGPGSAGGWENSAPHTRLGGRGPGILGGGWSVGKRPRVPLLSPPTQPTSTVQKEETESGKLKSHGNRLAKSGPDPLSPERTERRPQRSFQEKEREARQGVHLPPGGPLPRPLK